MAKDGVLYINTRSTLFAIAEGKGKPAAAPKPAAEEKKEAAPAKPPAGR